MTSTLSDRHLWIRILRYHFWMSLPLCSQYRGPAPLKMILILILSLYQYQYTTLILTFYDAHLHRRCIPLLRRNSWKHVPTFSMSDEFWQCRKLTFPFLWWAHERMHTPADLAFACTEAAWGSLSFHREAAFSNTPSREKGLWADSWYLLNAQNISLKMDISPGKDFFDVWHFTNAYLGPQSAVMSNNIWIQLNVGSQPWQPYY